MLLYNWRDIAQSLLFNPKWLGIYFTSDKSLERKLNQNSINLTFDY